MFSVIVLANHVLCVQWTYM